VFIYNNFRPARGIFWYKNYIKHKGWDTRSSEQLRSQFLHSIFKFIFTDFPWLYTLNLRHCFPGSFRVHLLSVVCVTLWLYFWGFSDLVSWCCLYKAVFLERDVEEIVWLNFSLQRVSRQLLFNSLYSTANIAQFYKWQNKLTNCIFYRKIEHKRKPKNRVDYSPF
jgi:hypothetical protein